MATEAYKLEDIPGVGPTTAIKLREAGYESVEKISQATTTELYDTAEIGEATARKMIKWCTTQVNPGASSSGTGPAMQDDSGNMVQRRFDIEDIPGVGPAIAEKLRDAGIEVQLACTLVLLRTNQF